MGGKVTGRAQAKGYAAGIDTALVKKITNYLTRTLSNDYCGVLAVARNEAGERVEVITNLHPDDEVVFLTRLLLDQISALKGAWAWPAEKCEKCDSRGEKEKKSRG